MEKQWINYIHMILYKLLVNNILSVISSDQV